MHAEQLDRGRVERQEPLAVNALGGLPCVVAGQALGGDDAAGDADRRGVQVQVHPPQRADLRWPQPGGGAQPQEHREVRFIGECPK
jgi:hypothetical protein